MPLRHLSFRLLLAGELISNFGTGSSWSLCPGMSSHNTVERYASALC